MPFIDLYEVLGVPKTASVEEIKKAFRKKAKESHPDVGGSEENFKRIKEAYDVLSNPSTRIEYDYSYTYYQNFEKNNTEQNNHNQQQNAKTKQRKQEKQEQEQPKQEKPKQEQPSDNEQEPKGNEQNEEPPFNWRAYFTGLAAIGVVILILVCVQLVPEPGKSAITLPTSNPQSFSQAFNPQPSTRPVFNVMKNQAPSSSQTVPTANAVVSQGPIQSPKAEPTKQEEPVEKESPKQENQPRFTLGSTKAVVKAAMGEPGTIENYPYNGDVWRYGLSSIEFDTNGKVKGWSFIKNGKATLGDKKSENMTFTLGSTKQQVVDAMGTPETIEAYTYNGDVWRYGLSSVNFNTKGQVVGWSFMKSGKAYMGDKKPSAGPIKEGSTKQEVVDAMGTPETVEYYPYNGDVWRYSSSSIEFDANDKVHSWFNLN